MQCIDAACCYRNVCVLGIQVSCEKWLKLGILVWVQATIYYIGIEITVGRGTFQVTCRPIVSYFP